MNKPPVATPLFTAADRLLLLQLLTRRAMADKRRIPNETIDDSEGPTRGSTVVAQGDVVPKRWRLVPEDVVLYDWQRECLPRWLERECGTIKVATGGGKTLFSLAVAQALQNAREPDLRVAVVVPTIPLMFQWNDELRQGNLPASAIGLMGGGQELPPLVSLRVLVCVLNSARERLPELIRTANWSPRMLLVVDECHRAAAAQARKIFATHPRYTLGLSATPEPDMELLEVPTEAAYNNGVVGQALGPIIYDFTLQQSLQAGLLTPFEVWHIGLPLTSHESHEHARVSREITELRKTLQLHHRRSRSKQSFLAWCQTQASRGGPAAAEAEQFLALASRRKRMLYRARARAEVTLGVLSESPNDTDRRVIVFHESIAEIETIYLEAIAHGIPAVLEHSELPDGLRADNIEAFREGVARVIVSAKSLVEGFNVPSADLGLIVASSSSVRQRIQSLGRLLRRKAGGRTAQVFVLYIRDSEDEAIYEKADWESLVGARQNRYFFWRFPDDGPDWRAGLEERPGPPKAYKPPAWDVDVIALSPGDPYPGQTHGQDLRVDQDGNLRSDDGLLIQAPRDLVDAISQYNSYRRARLTPPGHLIARADDPSRSGEADWRFLGQLDGEPQGSAPTAIRLRLGTSSGRRYIARDNAFAQGPKETREELLRWVRGEEGRLGRSVKDLYWDGAGRYWLEVSGERVEHQEALAPLVFAS